jgi:hypothetical protein
MNKHRTLEFRQQEGTLDPGRICAWADVVLAFVTKALFYSDEDLRTLDPTSVPFGGGIIDQKLIDALKGV